MNIIFSVFSGESGYFVGGQYEDRSQCIRLSHDLNICPEVGSTIPMLMATEQSPDLINKLIEHGFIKSPASYDVTDHIGRFLGQNCLWYDLCSMHMSIDIEWLFNKSPINEEC